MGSARTEVCLLSTGGTVPIGQCSVDAVQSRKVQVQTAGGQDLEAAQQRDQLQRTTRGKGVEESLEETR